MASIHKSKCESTASLPVSQNRLSIVVALLALSVFINYIDRGNLSIAAPMLKDELHLSGSQLGILLSSFFWTYGMFLVLSGWLVDRLNASWVMAFGFLLWSAATGVTGFLHSFTAMLVARLFLGAGESVAYPAYSKIFSKYFPDSQRGFANSLIACGLACGPAFGMLLGGTLMARFGWRSFFIGVGIISLLWLLPWFRWMPRGPGISQAQIEGPAPTSFDILKLPVAWATFAGAFCFAYILYFLVAWLPFYLVRERHFSMDSMAKIGAAIYLTQAVSSLLCGRLADRWAAGAMQGTVHKYFMVAGLTGGGIFLAASSVVGPVLSAILLIGVGAFIGLCTANCWPITQILAGPQASGRWTGLQNGAATYAGATASALTGVILDRTGHFFGAFAVTAGVSLLGALVWTFLVGKIEPVKWGLQRRTSVHVRKPVIELA